MMPSVKPVKKTYSEDATYLNFIRKEYRRRMAAHRSETDPGAGKERTRRQVIVDLISHHKVVSSVLAVLGIASLFFYARALMSIAAFIALLALASVSTFYKRGLGGTPISGFELVTFGTVISGVAFGPTAGLVFGVLSSLASELISINFGPLTWIYIATTASIGFFSGVFSNISIFFIGVAATMLTLLVNQVIYLFIGDEDIKGATIFYLLANISLNLVLFGVLGGKVLSIIS